jgi:hypothetical protein
MNSLNRKKLENGVADPVWIKDSARHFLLVSICVGGGFSILLLALVLFTALWHPAMLILSVVNGIALGGLTFLYRFLKQRMVHRVRRIAPELAGGTILAEGQATRLENRCMIRGWFYLTETRLVFVARQPSKTKKKAKTVGSTVFPMSEIRKIEAVNGAFVHRTLTLSTDTRRECVFLVEAPAKWAEQLKDLHTVISKKN